jgi:hypothetical protein
MQTARHSDKMTRKVQERTARVMLALMCLLRFVGSCDVAVLAGWHWCQLVDCDIHWNYFKGYWSTCPSICVCCGSPLLCCIWGDS